MRIRSIIHIAVIIVLLALTALQSPASPPRYKVTLVRTGFARGFAYLNDLGHALMFDLDVPIGSPLRVAVWRDGAVTDLGRSLAQASRINNRDHVSGISLNGSAVIDALDGTILAARPASPSDPKDSTTLLNNRDELVYTGISESSDRPTVLSASGQDRVLDMPTFLDMNDQTQVLGWSWGQDNGNNEQTSAGYVTMNSAGERTGFVGPGVVAWSLDNRGRVVCLYRQFVSNGRYTGCFWSDGVLTDLPIPSGDDLGFICARGLSDLGQAVGSTISGTNVRTVLWTGGQVYDLSTLIPSGTGYQLQGAMDVNNHGQILCGALHGTDPCLVLLTPEPGVKTWKGMAMVSAPSIPWETDPKKATGLDTSFWYAYDPASNTYAGYANHASWLDPAESTPVRGFWAKFDTETRVPLWIIPQQGRPVSVSLKQGWNLIGQPFLLPVDWNTDALQVKTPDGATRSLREASDAVRPFAWGWKQDPTNRNTGAYYMVAESTYNPSAVQQLQPWEGYWVKALKPCELILPPPPAEY